MNKLLIVGATTLFICLAFTPEITADETNFGNTLYVGGTGPGNYSRIQEAINDASDGDTVFVYSGTYYENVAVDKSIDLIGEDRDTTIIDGNEIGDVVYVTADGVNISGFTVRNSDGGIYCEGKTANIHDNLITLQRGPAIGISNSVGSTISNNIIINSGDGEGIIFNNCNDNYIIGNYLSNTSHGIHLSFSSNITIIDNNISNTGFGICLYSSSVNTITDNNISKNGDGIRLHSSSNKNIISGNNVNSNIGNGISMFDSPSYNIISDNEVLKNLFHGISLSSSSNNTIKGNNVSNNKDDGIVLCFSSFNTITDNNITVNMNSGIYLWGSSENTINGNNISNNNQGIVMVHDWHSSNNNLIYQNNFYDNAQNAFDESYNSWNNGKKGNYWDDYEEKYPYAHKKWLRGIWDTPYDIPGGDNHDRFPLTKPYGKSKSYVNPLFLQFLENHPDMFPILRHLLKISEVKNIPVAKFKSC